MSKAATGAVLVRVVCGVLMLAWIGDGTRASGQQGQPRIRVRAGFGGGGMVASDETSLIPPQDRDAESWLKRAQDAADREDWKLAADTLARVIQDHAYKVVSPDDGKHFYSAITCAQRQIASWPPAGLTAYRVLYDGDAQRLLDEALTTHDVEPLRCLVQKYPHTTAGPQAIELLAAWLIDFGRPSEALDALERLGLYSDERLPRWRVLKLRAIAQAAANMPAAAIKTLDEISKLTDAESAGRPADYSDQTEAVARFVEEAAKADPRLAAGTEPWKNALGPGSGHGRAMGVTPMITQQIPWRDGLPGVERVDERLALRLIDRTGRPPVWQAATDGRLLFVATPVGIVARDLSTFELAWQTLPTATGPEPVVTQFRGQTMGFQQATQKEVPRLDAAMTRALFHEYAGAVSYGHGLVFLIEQRINPAEQNPTKDGDAEPNPLSEIPPNSLRAFRADSGLTSWTIGQSGPVMDDLREAHFYSPPIEAGPYLVAPYEQRQDLYLAVISPEGKVIRKVQLGTGRPLMFPVNGVLTPTVVDGTIYVPTGAGMLVALNATDFSLRWLAQYDRVDTAKNAARTMRQRQQFMFEGQMTLSQPDEWVGSPAVAVGELVLLAPYDSEKLIAFDRRDGSIKWKVSRRQHRYIVGADEARVVIAGKDVSSIKLADGSREWTYQRSSPGINETMPSGRPVYAGDKVLVPAEGGLVTLDAATGKEIGEKAAYEEPLGNLFVAEGALYSVTATSIVKFPDVEWTRARATERLAKNPGDLDSVIRLAWLAALDNDWAKSLKLLDDAVATHGSGPATDDAVLDRVSHLRVTALLRLSEAQEGEQRGILLERASSAARQASDAVDAGLSLTDHLADANEFRQSFEKGFELLSRFGAQPIAVEAGLNGRAGIVIAERLRRYWNELKDESIRKEIAGSVLARARKMNDDAAREALEDGLGFMGEAAALDLERARSMNGAGDLETAAFYLDRAARRAADPTVAAEALVRLARLYAEPGEGLAAAPALAAGLLSRLESRYGERKLEDGQGTGNGTSVKEFVGQMRGRLGLGANATPRSGEREQRWGDGRLKVLDQNIETFPVTTRSFRVDRGEGQDFGEAMPLRYTRNVFGVRIAGDVAPLARSARPLWSSATAAATESAVGNSFGAEPLPSTTGTANAAAVAGRIAVLDTGPAFQAVGLVTGRCMWRPLAIDRTRGDLPNPPVAAASGIAVMAPDASTLVGVPARDGAEPLWTRDFGRVRLASLWQVEGRVAAIDRNANNLYLIEPESGRIARQFRLATGGAGNSEAGDSEAVDADAHVAVVGGVVCRSGDKKVLGWDIATGRALWEIPLKARVRGIQALDGGHIGVSYRGDRFAIVRIDSGEVAKELTIGDLELPPLLVALEGRESGRAGRLIVYAKTDDETAEYKLVIYALDGKEPAFQGPWKHATLTRRMLTESPDYVSVIRYDKREGNENDNQFQVQMQGGQMQIVNGAPAGSVRGAGLWIYDKNKDLERVAKYEFDRADPDEPTTNIFGGVNGTFGGGRINISDVIMGRQGVIVVGPMGYCVLGNSGPVDSVSAKQAGEAAKP